MKKVLLLMLAVCSLSMAKTVYSWDVIEDSENPNKVTIELDLNLELEYEPRLEMVSITTTNADGIFKNGYCKPVYESKNFSCMSEEVNSMADVRFDSNDKEVYADTVIRFDYEGKVGDVINITNCFAAAQVVGHDIESYISDLSYTLVPEPATLGLLGLGGLFLRKRKK